MNPDLILCTFIASGTGWYAGHYFERKKARKALGHVISTSMFAATTIANAAVELLKKVSPDYDVEVAATELLAICKREGMEAIAISKKEAIARGLVRDPNNKA